MRRTTLFSILILALVTLGCGKGDNPTAPDPGAAQQEAQLGDEALADGDFAAANLHYKIALTKDPNNAQANIGAAITEVYLLQNDSELAGYIDALGNTGLPVRGGGDLESTPARLRRTLGVGDTRFDPIGATRFVGRLATLGTTDPPMLSDIQRAIKLKVMPKLQYAEDRLNTVEANPSWRYLLLPSVTEEPDTLEIDLGEVYTLDAVINSLQGFLGLAVAYNFDTPNESANPESLLAAGTDFGRVHADGPLQLAAARLNWLNAKTRLDAAIAFINAETDDQTDDVIPQEVIAQPEFVQWKSKFDQIQTSLSAPVTVSIDDYQGNPRDISIEVGKFFTNPILDWKTKLPAHTYDAEHQPVVTDPIDFPDPQFNLIFPGTTDADWQAILGPVNPPPPTMARR